jgi:spore coat protein U-like protein
MRRGAKRTIIPAIFAVASIAGLESAATAAPASCSFSITAVNFGTIDVRANTVFDTTATFSATCTGDARRTIRVCPNIGEGSGGSSGGNPRLLTSGTNQLAYNLYRNSGRTTVWGSYLWPYSSTPPTVNVSLNALGTGSASRTIYARVLAGQQTKPSGLYSSSFVPPHTAIAYAYSTAGNCNAIGATNITSVPFTVTAVNIATCSVSATAVDFGSTGVLDSARDGSGTLTLTCTALAPYTVALSGGNDGASDPTQRKMSSGAEKVTYGLYRDSARILPWGSANGVNTVGGIGTGASQSLTVYGRVPVQATPSPGAYSDTVVVTLTY